MNTTGSSHQKNRIASFLALCALAASLLSGCGGGGSQPALPESPTSTTAGRGAVSVTIHWPTPGGRLIPAASAEITLVFTQGTTTITSQNFTKPAQGSLSTGTISNLPVGSVTATATAHPAADGSGTAQATGSTVLTIQANQTTPFNLTMISTIATVSVMPATLSLTSGGATGTLTADTLDSSGNVVMVVPGNIQFSTSNPSIATVSTAGVVTPVSAGTATITVTEAESGDSGTASVTVSAPARSVFGWGYNSYGELGNGTINNSNVPVQANGLSGVIAVAAGQYHSLALKSDGTLWAWGENTDGELGNGTNTGSTVPIQVSSLSGVTAIAAGTGFSLVVKSDGTVWAFGYNADSELGNGSTTNSSVPVQVSGLSGVVAVAAEELAGLALKSDGTVWGWGNNQFGELGNGTFTGSSVPVQTAGLSGVASIAGGHYHSLAVKSDGTVWAWGRNDEGQLGNGTTPGEGTDSDVPVQVSGLSGVTSVAGGYKHSLAARSDGTVWAWGWNPDGELGNGTTTNSNLPVQVSSLSGVTAVAAGAYHSLALKSGGTLWAWGSNGYGQLGNGPSGGSSTVPVQVSGLSGVTTAAGGEYFSLAVQ